ncbi:MAG: UDP-N-acetylmuramate--L-alanine ligase [Gemmatimonadetes bacterium]|nr:UDP-N-acetylmuramate--L-alanine ligase [Gemmatimonadota bacterium]
MSALAELFVRRGLPVSGCDANLAGVDDLRRLGVRLFPSHDAGHVENSRGIVVTSAMPKDHPELVRARSLGIPVVRRAEALGAAVNAGRLVAVAGTHGKTTTTTLATEALASAGLDPTGVVGARVAAWQGNFRRGGDDVFVVEADEYDRSFLALTPTVAVITNVEADHLDIYRDLDDIRAAFARFAAGARYVVICADDAGARSVPLADAADVIPYGLSSPGARLLARDLGPAARGLGTRCRVHFDGRELGELHLRIPGEHNVRNALAAVGAGLALGASFSAMCEGLAAVEGAERRFQLLGERGGVTVIDDYAHHPSEIEATLAAARAVWPGRRLVAAFQPHLYTRTRDFAAGFGRALVGADVALLADLYPAREQPIAGVSSALIAAAARAAGRAVQWEGPRGELAAALRRAVHPGDVVITLGAGDITKTGPELLDLLT